MEIKITTTINVDKDVEDELTQNDINEMYKTFRDIIQDTSKSKDLTRFSFINTDTNREVENDICNTKTSYIYQLIYNGDVIDQTSLDERNENLAYEILMKDRDEEDERLMSVILLKEIEEEIE